jgi:hypothetical protein
MAIKFSIESRNAQLDAHETTIGASPKLRILTGSAPATCATAQSGTLLAELTLPADWASNAASGAKSLLGSWSGTVVADGTAGYYRILNNAGTTCHEQGTIGTSGQDLNGTSTALTTGQVLVITAKTLTAGNA